MSKFLLPNERSNQGLLIFAHGVPGSGKSSFFANATNPLFMIDSQETGILNLKEFGLAPESVKVWNPSFTKNWTLAKASLQQLIDSPDEFDYDSLVLESVTGFEKLCFQYVCDELFDGEWTDEKTGFYSFYKGPNVASKEEWPEFLELLSQIRNTGKNVILTGHSHAATYKNPTGPDYDRWVPFLDDRIWKVTERWAECVLFFDFEQEVERLKGSAKVKGVGEANHVIRTVRADAYTAKNQIGLKATIDAASAKEAWDDFYSQVQANRSK